MNQLGHSSTSSTMGAVIRVAGPALGLYLVIGRRPDLEALVTKAGGQSAVRLTPTKLLAVLPFEVFMALKADPRLIRIGPVSIDPARAGRLSETLAGTTVVRTDTGYE